MTGSRRWWAGIKRKRRNTQKIARIPPATRIVLVSVFPVSAILLAHPAV
jgi:hypothetical protein